MFRVGFSWISCSAEQRVWVLSGCQLSSRVAQAPQAGDFLPVDAFRRSLLPIPKVVDFSFPGRQHRGLALAEILPILRVCK